MSVESTRRGMRHYDDPATPSLSVSLSDSVTHGAKWSSPPRAGVVTTTAVVAHGLLPALRCAGITISTWCWFETFN